jgi:Cu(I)-responsive transcriptional regulator
MPRPMNISEAADAAEITPKMIRHYEQIGLVPAPARTDAGYRQYSERDVSILRFIRQSRKLGFSMDQIADLLGLWSDDGRASREVKALAQGHLAALEEKMNEMAAMQRALKKLVASCHGDDDPHCAILDELAVSSPEAPEPGEVGARPVRRTAGKKQSPRVASQAGSGAHADLMAWTRGLRADHSQH